MRLAEVYVSQKWGGEGLISGSNFFKIVVFLVEYSNHGGTCEDVEVFTERYPNFPDPSLTIPIKHTLSEK